MADVVIKAAYATVAEEDGVRFIGFVDDQDESYALFSQPLAGGPVWFEVNDEDFGAEDAVSQAIHTAGGLVITLRPELAARFGYATSFDLRLEACAGAAPALSALAAMLGQDLLAAAQP
jgi:hypothetical protein